MKILRLLAGFFDVCALRGHSLLEQRIPGFIYLECSHCGKRTQGWEIEVDPKFKKAKALQARPAAPSREEARQLFDELMDVELGLGCGG
jgi:hypothetical protein